MKKKGFIVQYRQSENVSKKKKIKEEKRISNLFDTNVLMLKI